MAAIAPEKPLFRRLLGEGVQGVLLYGSEGAGQEDLGRQLAQAGLCLAPTEQGACGVCQPCGAFQRGTNADFQLIRPWGKSNLIKTGAIREIPNSDFEGVPIQGFVRTLPLMSANKVVLFHDVDRLVSEAANSFLKTLEEPGPRARFILTTRAIGRVLPTIISRCLTIACVKEPPTEGLDIIGQTLYEVPQYERVAEKPEILRRLLEIAQELPTTPKHGALQLSERFREVAESLPLGGEDSSRTRQAAALELFAAMVRAMHPNRGDWIAALLEAHRRIVGNAVGALAFDALFMQML